MTIGLAGDLGAGWGNNLATIREILPGWLSLISDEGIAMRQVMVWGWRLGSGAIGALLGMSLGMMGAIAQPAAPSGSSGSSPKPSFFEESRRPARTGFSETFVIDALDGRADPLGGRSATGSGVTVISTPVTISTPITISEGANRPRSITPSATLNNPSPSAPLPAGLPPGFDRTTVIIRR